MTEAPNFNLVRPPTLERAKKSHDILGPLEGLSVVEVADRARGKAEQVVEEGALGLPLARRLHKIYNTGLRATAERLGDNPSESELRAHLDLRADVSRIQQTLMETPPLDEEQKPENPDITNTGQYL